MESGEVDFQGMTAGTPHDCGDFADSGPFGIKYRSPQDVFDSREEGRAFVKKTIFSTAKQIRAKYGIDDEARLSLLDDAAAIQAYRDAVEACLRIMGFTDIEFVEFK